LNGKVKVLVVDDRPEKLVALESVIGDLAQVVTADSGKNALRCLMQDDFAVILLDVNMPAMNGFETAALIRKRDRCARTPIIFITSYAESETHAAEGYSLGAVDFIHAPIVPNILRAKVAVFVDLFEKNQQVKRQAEERIQLEREQTARAIAQAAEKRARFLSEASKILASSFDYSDVLQRAAQHCVPTLADIAVFNLSDTDGAVSCVAAAAPDAEKLDALRALLPASTRSDADPFGVGQVIRTRIPRIENNATAPGDGMAGLGILAFAVLPLASRDNVQGALLLASTDPTRRFGALDLALAQEFASRASMALENSFLYQSAEQANRAKDEFLAVISHELRTPMTPIVGWVRLLMHQKPDAALLARGMEVIERNVRAQMKLIEDLLDVSRVITGKLKLQIQTVDLTRLLSNAIEAVRTAADGKNIRLVAEFDSTVRCDARVDPDRVQQAVWNLLSNSIKFTPPDGEVRIALICDERHLRIQVSDTGRGIRREFLPHVFERFRQADGSTTRAYGGLGIGLAIVRHIVELHGGSVTAESEGEGKGARITLSLPRHSTVAADVTQDSSSSSSHAARTHPQLAGRQVLLVEDDPDTRLLISTILEHNGLDVTAVSSAAEALNALSLLSPDLLISDIGMPGEDGYALIRRIRQRRSEGIGFVPAIALTAYAKEEDRSRAMEAGFQLHLSKPIEPNYLLEAIATTLQTQHKPA